MNSYNDMIKEFAEIAIENYKNGITFEESAKRLTVGDSVLRRAILERWTGKEI